MLILYLPDVYYMNEYKRMYTSIVNEMFVDSNHDLPKIS